jgi:hypothetical protein
MATTKRINGDFTIKSVDNNVDTFSIERFRTVTINGDLQVLGNTTSVETTNTTINDNIIVLNQGETGAGVTRVFSGIQVDRGTSGNVILRWNETFNRWQLTNNGTNFGNIATFTVDPFITELSQDASPQLGGNIDVMGYTIFNSVANLNVIVDAGIQLSNRGTDLPAETGNVVVYANTVAGGGSGVYVSNSDVVGQELVTKTKAIVYALIL